MLDALRVLGSAQAVTTATTTRTTNTVDFGGDFDMGPGEAKGIMFVINVTGDFTTGDETHNFQLRTDDNTSFSSPTILAETGVQNGPQSQPIRRSEVVTHRHQLVRRPLRHRLRWRHRPPCRRLGHCVF